MPGSSAFLRALASCSRFFCSRAAAARSFFWASSRAFCCFFAASDLGRKGQRHEAVKHQGLKLKNLTCKSESKKPEMIRKLLFPKPLSRNWKRLSCPTAKLQQLDNLRILFDFWLQLKEAQGCPSILVLSQSYDTWPPLCHGKTLQYPCQYGQIARDRQLSNLISEHETIRLYAE